MRRFNPTKARARAFSLLIFTPSTTSTPSSARFRPPPRCSADFAVHSTSARAVHSSAPLVPPTNLLNAHAGPSRMPSIEGVDGGPSDVVSTSKLEDFLSKPGVADGRSSSAEEVIANLQTLVRATGSISTSSTVSSQPNPLLPHVSSISHRLSTLLTSLPSSSTIPPSLLYDLFTLSQTCYILSYHILAPPTLKSSSTTSSFYKRDEPLPTVLSSKAILHERNVQASDARKSYILLLRYLISQAESSPTRDEIYQTMLTSLENLFAQLAADKVFKRVRLREEIRRKKDKSVMMRKDGMPADLVSLYLKVNYKLKSGKTGRKISEEVMDSLREMEILSLHSFSDERFSNSPTWSMGQEATEEYAAYVKDVIVDVLCGSKAGLQQTLSRLDPRDEKDWEGLGLVWEAVVERLKDVEKGKGKEVETSWLGEKDDQVVILTRFLQLFLQGLSTFASSSMSNSRTRISQLSASLDVLFSLLPSPTPKVIYQTLISHYARSDAVELGGPNSSLHALRAVWTRMKNEGVVRDVKTYMMCMEGMGRKGDAKGLREVWEELRIDKACREEWEREEREKLASSENSSAEIPPYPPISIFNCFINLLLLLPRGEGTALALSLFEYLASPENPYRLDIVTINTVLRHYAGLKDTKAMLHILERLPTMGDPKSPLKPDVITYTTVIDGLLSAENRKLANHLLRDMQEAGIQPSMHTYSLLVADLAGTGMRHHLLAAEQMITSMTEAGMKPNEVTWTSLVGGYFKGGYTTDAWSTLARMRILKVPFNRVTFNMILRWCAGSPSVQMEGSILRHINTALRMSAKPQLEPGQRRGRHLCLDILDAMQAAHIQPNEDSWFLALDGLMRARKWTEAFAVLEEMTRKKFVVKPGSALHAVVQRARRAGDR